MNFTALLALLVLAPVVAAGAVAAGKCQSSTATSVTVSVPTDAKSDFYDIQFGLDQEARLHSLHWSNVINAPETSGASTAEARLWDLKPNTTYFFWVRHHTKSTYRYHGLSEGWTNFSDVWSCHTSQDASPSAPSRLNRQGKLASTAVGVSWTAPKERAHFAHYKVEWCTISGTEATSCAFTNNATKSATNAQISGLAMGKQHVVRVCAVSSDGTEECGSEQMLRTSQEGRKYVNMYRVTQGEVDFLSNHNTADIAAQALYMTGTEDATGAFQPFKLNAATVAESCVEMIDRPYANYLSCNTIPLPSKLFPTKRYDFCT
jgi:hypothetical protein